MCLQWLQVCVRCCLALTRRDRLATASGPLCPKSRLRVAMKNVLRAWESNEWGIRTVFLVNVLLQEIVAQATSQCAADRALPAPGLALPKAATPWERVLAECLESLEKIVQRARYQAPAVSLSALQAGEQTAATRRSSLCGNRDPRSGCPAACPAVELLIMRLPVGSSVTWPGCHPAVRVCAHGV